jgi:microcystin-dependent protein
MADPYVGEVRLFAGNFAPLGWALCQGQQLAISQNEVLFQLIGTTYGGDGENTFALPDLRSRVPLHQGNGPGLSNRVIGQQGGSEQVTLTTGQMPAHTHAQRASKAAAQAAAGSSGSVLAAAAVNLYGNGPPTTPMAAGGIASSGGGQPHENMAPFQAMNYIISLYGVFPSPA